MDLRSGRPAFGLERACPAWYAYSPGRSGEYPEAHLAGWRGALQADAFAGYNRLYADAIIVEVGCWAHARRKFYDQYVKKKTAVNTEAWRVWPSCSPSKPRSAENRPTLGERCARHAPGRCCGTCGPSSKPPLVSVHSDTARAINYALNQWQALTRYVNDGRLKAENNAAERALRAVALGRKNSICTWDWTRAASAPRRCTP
ncbi:IS66 family transposase [Achromobacter xylosoxidans]|uniref:IS66 family transposase n=1 Tax=Alcaligenes xylosoxydans xylosoxydans TaxID=85698 RepID=UPI003F626195